jgi:hypothetical protein
VEQYAEDFEGFLVTEKRSQHLGALEGERQRTVKEWFTFMGQPTEYGDILSKEETMETSSDRHRPQVSDFQDDDTLRFAYQQHQFHGVTYYN